MKMLKILVVGTGNHYIYQDAMCDAFKQIGHYCEVFKLNSYFFSDNVFFRFLKKIENHFVFGGDVIRLNKDLVSYVEKKGFDLVFLYGCNMIYPRTVIKLQSSGSKVFSYQNDDIFSDYYSWYLYRYAKKILTVTDKNYVFRQKNIKDIEHYCRRIDSSILRAYYIDKDNYKCKREELIQDTPDVICLAHYENDNRMDFLCRLLDENIVVGVNSELYECLPEKYKDTAMCITESRAPYYNRRINSTKIPIIFLSKLNHDTYTTRCFEIPAAGALIFCEYTDEMNDMFIEGKEAVYFRSEEDFVLKIKYYLSNDCERKRIANAGYQRLIRDGHEVKNRAKTVLTDYFRLIEDKIEIGVD